jgi:TatD DNase family protein
MRLVDAHLHLQEEILEGFVPDVLAVARSEGVGLFVSNGTHTGDWEATLAIAREHPDVVPCFGLHPWFIAEQPDDWPDRLESYLTAVPSGVGETGLGGACGVPMEEQVRALRLHLDLAKRLGRPLMLHCIRAVGRLLEVLRSDGPPEAGFLLHAYAGSAESVPDFARLGGWFSFGGGSLHEGRRRAHLAVSAVPLDRLLVETDAPALLPPPEYRAHLFRSADGRSWNAPANLASIVRGIARLRAMDAAELGEITARNARAFLGGDLCATLDSHEPS